MTVPARADCRRALSDISAYLDGDLGAGACDAIEEHCRNCAACAEVVQGLRETVGLCRQAGSVPLPETVRRRARASVKRLLDEEEGRSTVRDPAR